MITAPECHDPRSVLAAVAPVLMANLQRNFDGRGAVVTIEKTRTIPQTGKLHQLFGKRDSRFMGDSREVHVIQIESLP